MEIYVVESGNSVDSIAEDFAVSPEDIIYINQLKYPYSLAVGQALVIPGGEPANDQRPAWINGYAYPFIEESVLNETLPYLTTLSVFSYGFTTEGELIPPVLPDEGLVGAALEAGVSPVLTLTPFGENGMFNNSLISAVVNNGEAEENLLSELLQTVENKGYEAVDVDFEYVKAEDRDAFTEFVSNLTQRMNQGGYRVSVALAPKVSTDQQGLLYQGKDYAGLGAAANSVLLMTYEWGYTYGPPMAVAPVNKVRQVVEYAVTQIPVDKIDMGIPNYGYDWTLPYERGVSKARTLGNVEAVEQAVSVGATIQFDETAKSPYYNYILDGVEHEVWFEDARSIEAKCQLIKEFNLRGAGYWQIMKLFLGNWAVVDNNFEIIKV